jgi:ATP-dependent DNA helicase RecQ
MGQVCTTSPVRASKPRIVSAPRFATQIVPFNARRSEPPAEAADAAQRTPDRTATDDGLFESLRALRRRLADARGIPAYMVFSDATLLEMVETRPRTGDGLLQISGVGPKKLAQYGDAFLELMRGTS